MLKKFQDMSLTIVSHSKYIMRNADTTLTTLCQKSTFLQEFNSNIFSHIADYKSLSNSTKKSFWSKMQIQ